MPTVDSAASALCFGLVAGVAAMMGTCNVVRVAWETTMAETTPPLRYGFLRFLHATPAWRARLSLDWLPQPLA